MYLIHHTHADLVRLSIQGNTGAFSELVTRFEGMAFAICLSMIGEAQLAQDAVQEAFLDAYVNLHRLRNPEAFPGWFRRVVVKHADRVTRQRQIDPLPDKDIISVHVHDPAVAFDAIEHQRQLQAAIRSLPGTHRLPVILHYLQGQSVQDIADFLGLPVSTVKKRLFDARQKLKEQIVMPQLSATIEFFIALKENDTPRVMALIDANPDLINARTAWGDVSEGYYFPIGLNAAAWAAGTGNLSLLQNLHERGTDLHDPDILFEAITMHQVEIVKWLLAQGVSLAVTNKRGLSPLHAAVMAGSPTMTALLLEHGHPASVVDSTERTPLDWAFLQSDPALIEVLGGKSPASANHAQTATINFAGSTIPLLDEAPTAYLQTGIKVIDFFCPLRRGGHNGIFTPLAGVGLFVVMGELFNNLIRYHNTAIVSVLMEEGPYTGDNMMLAWRDMGVHEHIHQVAVHQQDGITAVLNGVKTAYSIAEYLRSKGQDVLLLVDSRLVTVERVTDYLQASQAITPQSAITILFHGKNTPETNPALFGHLDTLITFDKRLARAGLWPAVDRFRSASSVVIDPDLVNEVKAVLQRYEDLDLGDEDDLPLNGSDYEIAIRARLLQRYFTQPFHIATMFTLRPGAYVPVTQMLADVRRILGGGYDDISPADLYMIGAL